MINLKILELWGLSLGALLKQILSASKIKRRHSVPGIWAWGRDIARSQMGVGSWVMMVSKFSSPGSQGEHQNSSDRAAGWGLGSGRTWLLRPL